MDSHAGETGSRERAPAKSVDVESIEVVCPSGLAGRIRGMIGKDYRSINKALARTGEGMTRILNACWVETTDPGIYRTNAAGNIDWNDAIVGDRLFALIAIRRAMYPGEPYPFDATCRERACRERIHWQLDLAELEVKPLPETSRELLRAGKNEFSVDVGGTTVTFAILTGREQGAAHKLVQKAFRDAEKDSKPSDIILTLAARTKRVAALDDDADYLDKVAWLEDLPSAEHRKLIRSFDRVDGGVNTTIEIECQQPTCASVQEVELPFDASFLFPK